MSHFYGEITRSARRTAATARAHKSTGLTVAAKTWNTIISVELDHVNGQDVFTVVRTLLPSGAREVVYTFMEEST